MVNQLPHNSTSIFGSPLMCVASSTLYQLLRLDDRDCLVATPVDHGTLQSLSAITSLPIATSRHPLATLLVPPGLECTLSPVVAARPSWCYDDRQALCPTSPTPPVSATTISDADAWKFDSWYDVKVSSQASQVILLGDSTLSAFSLDSHCIVWTKSLQKLSLDEFDVDIRFKTDMWRLDVDVEGRIFVILAGSRAVAGKLEEKPDENKSELVPFTLMDKDDKPYRGVDAFCLHRNQIVVLSGNRCVFFDYNGCFLRQLSLLSSPAAQFGIVPWSVVIGNGDDDGHCILYVTDTLLSRLVIAKLSTDDFAASSLSLDPVCCVQFPVNHSPRSVAVSDGWVIVTCSSMMPNGGFPVPYEVCVFRSVGGK